jgi:hypothetical protein
MHAAVTHTRVSLVCHHWSDIHILAPAAVPPLPTPSCSKCDTLLTVVSQQLLRAIAGLRRLLQLAAFCIFDSDSTKKSWGSCCGRKAGACGQGAVGAAVTLSHPGVYNQVTQVRSAWYPAQQVLPASAASDW